ncbi:MAG: 23S rRNA (pseudouridine(1915)-N(3))-methyltransferase RlmH [Clostridia bacterium]
MKIKVVAVGNLKDKFNQLGAEEYIKRLKRFCTFEMKEVTEENFVKEPNESEIKEILKREGTKISKEIEGALVVLDIDGEKLSSPQLSKKIDDIFLSASTITFVVGGSYGLDGEIKKLARLRLSFSDMTFPHGLFRVMLLEQIYRAMSIKANLPYHK